MMRVIGHKHCRIGEGPIWNDAEQCLYFTNGMEKEICKLDLVTGRLTEIPTERGVSAIAFDRSNRTIVSRADGVSYLDPGAAEPLYDPTKVQILHANDMKVGPDGRIYVGTQSEKRLKLSERVDGKLYSIDRSGTVRTLLDGLLLSNGMDWSMDETRFYHTDSATHIIREYAFEKASGEIEATGRSVEIHGVDGFTIDENDFLYVARWGHAQIAVVDTRTMREVDRIEVPAQKPASCAFAGADMTELVAVTAAYNVDLATDPLAGCTFHKSMPIHGRKPYLF